MGSAAFWVAVFERAVKTFAQGLVAFVGTNFTGITDVPWQTAASVAGLAAVLSVLTSIASGKAGGAGPSLGGAEQLPASKHA
jgi:hypothetical protein